MGTIYKLEVYDGPDFYIVGGPHGTRIGTDEQGVALHCIALHCIALEYDLHISDANSSARKKSGTGLKPETKWTVQWSR